MKWPGRRPTLPPAAVTDSVASRTSRLGPLRPGARGDCGPPSDAEITVRGRGAMRELDAEHMGGPARPVNARAAWRVHTPAGDGAWRAVGSGQPDTLGCRHRA